MKFGSQTRARALAMLVQETLVWQTLEEYGVMDPAVIVQMFTIVQIRMAFSIIQPALAPINHTYASQHHLNRRLGEEGRKALVGALLFSSLC